MRFAPADAVFQKLPCGRCADQQRYWDRIDGKVYCPNCVEDLVNDEGDPVGFTILQIRCAICQHLGAVSFQTFPLHAHHPLDVELCSEHLRALLARRLTPLAFKILQIQLLTVGVDARMIFLLHEAFYDELGNALQPAQEIS